MSLEIIYFITKLSDRFILLNLQIGDRDYHIINKYTFEQLIPKSNISTIASTNIIYYDTGTIVILLDLEANRIYPLTFFHLS